MIEANSAPYVVFAEDCRQCNSRASKHDLYRVAGLSPAEATETCSMCQGAGIQYQAEKNENYLVARLPYRFVVVGDMPAFKKVVNEGGLVFDPPVKLKEAHTHIRFIELDTSNNRHVGGQYMELQISFQGIDGTIHPYETIQYTPMPKQHGNVISLVKKGR